MTNKIKLSFLDILPNREELLKYATFCSNSKLLVEFDSEDDEVLNKAFDEFYANCEELGLSDEAVNELIDSLVIARAFYLAQTDIELEVELESDLNSDLLQRSESGEHH